MQSIEVFSLDVGRLSKDDPSTDRSTSLRDRTVFVTGPFQFFIKLKISLSLHTRDAIPHSIWSLWSWPFWPGALPPLFPRTESVSGDALLAMPELDAVLVEVEEHDTL
ncbi:MAG: hypothetical protein CML13_05545 [Puniceicoccaceae bacterium]|nr:hypothetical protein [Puniceicoccaceae bacterium]|tara:strand:- start:3203 stop:3526 length:324 start_codon:yes stop_codon:yes gene_type:complete